MVTRISFVLSLLSVVNALCPAHILSILARPEWMVGCPAAHGCSADSLPLQVLIYRISSGSLWKLAGYNPLLLTPKGITRFYVN